MVTRPPVNKHQDRSVSLRERCEWMTRGPGSDEPPRAQTNPSLMATGGLFPELPEREGGAGDRACQESASLLPTPHAPCLGVQEQLWSTGTRQACLPASVTMGAWVSPVNPEPPFSYLKNGDINTWLAELAWKIS